MTLIHGDCLKVLETLPRVKCCWADPPDNLGLKYNGFVDFRPDYYPWLATLIEKSLSKCDIFWLSYYWKHDLEVKRMAWEILRHRPAWKLKTFIWRYTFGQHNNHDFGSGFRFILRFTLDGAILHEPPRVKSWRQEHGDPRANPEGRIPDDYWEDSPEVIDIPRVTGNSRERRKWHPTQHPESLMRKVILQSCSVGDTFCDLFEGSGTSGIVCGRYGIPHIGIELSDFYFKKLVSQ